MMKLAAATFALVVALSSSAIAESTGSPLGDFLVAFGKGLAENGAANSQHNQQALQNLQNFQQQQAIEQMLRAQQQAQTQQHFNSLRPYRVGR